MISVFILFPTFELFLSTVFFFTFVSIFSYFPYGETCFGSMSIGRELYSNILETVRISAYFTLIAEMLFIYTIVFFQLAALCTFWKTRSRSLFDCTLLYFIERKWKVLEQYFFPESYAFSWIITTQGHVFTFIDRLTLTIWPFLFTIAYTKSTLFFYSLNL